MNRPRFKSPRLRKQPHDKKQSDLSRFWRSNSRGGVAPAEVSRMIADRRERLAEARGRHLKRIEALEEGQQMMLTQLHELGKK